MRVERLTDYLRVQEFDAVIDKCVEELQERFKEGLEEKCQIGATNVGTTYIEHGTGR